MTFGILSVLLDTKVGSEGSQGRSEAECISALTPELKWEDQQTDSFTFELKN
jgi:hypothetical protein